MEKRISVLSNCKMASPTRNDSLEADENDDGDISDPSAFNVTAAGVADDETAVS